MAGQVFDPVAMSQLKITLTDIIPQMTDGQVRMFPGFLIFRRGVVVGAAIETDAYINIHNVHPGRSFNLDGDSALPGVPGSHLVLSVNIAETDVGDGLKLESFVNMILAFVTEQNGNRQRLLSDPWSWAEKIIEMTGDQVAIERPYPYLAELFLAEKLREAGLLTDIGREYRGPDASSHDFELSQMSLEAKAHLHAAGDDKESELVISSEHQLARTAGKPLYVVYFRMEETGDMTIESMVGKFREGDRQCILQKLQKNGLVEGDFAWRHPYHLQREPQVFEITPDFPRITPSQFANGQFPAGITKLVYHVSLHNLPYQPLSAFIQDMCG